MNNINSKIITDNNSFPNMCSKYISDGDMLHLVKIASYYITIS